MNPNISPDYTGFRPRRHEANLRSGAGAYPGRFLAAAPGVRWLPERTVRRTVSK